MQVFPCNGITKLGFNNCGEAVYFDWLFLTFPSLEKLQIEERDQDWTTSDNYNSHSTNLVPNLRKITAYVKSMNQKCFDFLARNAPNIKKLYVSGESRPLTGGLSIDISKWELEQLDVLFCKMDSRGNCYYHIKTPYLDEVIKYTPRQDSVALVKKRVYSSNNTKPPMIDIIARDDSHFMFFGCRISLTQRKFTLTLSN
jgi:hypothetical protein